MTHGLSDSSCRTSFSAGKLVEASPRCFTVGSAVSPVLARKLGRSVVSSRLPELQAQRGLCFVKGLGPEGSISFRVVEFVPRSTIELQSFVFVADIV